jgi:hypothetical protein
MKHKLIKTENYLLVVDDSEIKESRLRYIFDNRQGLNGFIHQVSVVLDSKLCPEIIAHLPLNNAPILEGVPLLPPLEDYVEQLARTYTVNTPDNDPVRIYAFIAGYNKAKEKYKYTEEDLRIAIQQAFLSGVERLEDFEKVESMIKGNIQQPKYPVAFESTIGVCSKWLAEQCDNNCCGQPEKIKTIISSQGQTQLVGTYIYE